MLTRRGIWKALRDVLVVVGIAAVPLQVGWLAVEIWPEPTAVDFDARQVWHQANRIRAGEQLYRPIPGYGPRTMEVSTYPDQYGPYPPLLGSIVALLPARDRATFDRAWYPIRLLGLWAYAAALGLLATGRLGWRETAIGHAIILLTPGAWFVVETGNVDPILWGLYGLALAVPAFRGTGLTLTAAVKPFAVFPLAFAALREGRSVLVPAAWTAAAGVLVCLAALGTRLPATILDWFRYVPGDLSQGTWAAQNVSLGFLPLRILRWAGWDPGPGRLPLPAHLWVFLASVAAPLLAGFLTRRWKPPVQYGLVLTVALAFAPSAWLPYLPYALAPLAAALGPSANGAGPAGGEA